MLSAKQFMENSESELSSPSRTPSSPTNSAKTSSIPLAPRSPLSHKPLSNHQLSEASSFKSVSKKRKLADFLAHHGESALQSSTKQSKRMKLSKPLPDYTISPVEDNVVRHLKATLANLERSPMPNSQIPNLYKLFPL